MFGRIARRYDLLNTVMSGGRHHAWRQLATSMAVEGLTGPALDVATGTGDFALDLARRPEVSAVVGVDFAPQMLQLGRLKAGKEALAPRIEFAAADAHALPFADEAFMCVTVGFGLRNFADVPRALREMARVVRPGGRVAILEIVPTDGKGPVGRLFPLYFRHVTPWLGALLAGDREAYTYLPESVQAFRTADELAGLMQDAGLTEVSYRRLALGTVAILIGTKE